MANAVNAVTSGSSMAVNEYYAVASTRTVGNGVEGLSGTTSTEFSPFPSPLVGTPPAAGVALGNGCTDGRNPVQ